MSEDTRSKVQRPVWINEKTQPGLVVLDGKTYQIGKHEYPFDEAAERNTLGSLLVAGEIGKANESLMRIPFLHYDDFYFLRHAYIFRAMERLYLREHQIDLSTVIAELARQQTKEGSTLLDVIGGELYLSQLTTIVAANIETYAQIVVLRAVDRAMIALGDIIADLGRNQRMEMPDKVVQLQATVQNLTIRASTLTSRDTHLLYDALDAHIEQFKRELVDDKFEPGIPTGFKSLDKVILGWRRSKLYIFAAPSGWGKTALFLCAALNALRAGKRVLYISLEMPVREMLDRLICIQGKVDSGRFAERKLEPNEIQRVYTASEEIQAFRESRNFVIARMKRPTLPELRAKIAEFHPLPGVDIVFVDYAIANKFSGGERFGGDAGEFAFVSSIYGELEAIKEDFDIPLVVATQMNSRWQKRKNKRPEMGDLYYGKAGEFAADVIAFIYHEQYVSDDPENLNAELIFRKNRSGRMARDVTAELNWQPEYTLFSDDGADERIKPL